MLLPPEIVMELTGEEPEQALARVADAETLELLIEDTDMDHIHIEEHLICANNPATPPEAKQLLLAHAAEHQMRVQQAMEQEKEMMLDMKRQESLADATGVMATTLAASEASNEAKMQQEIVKNPTFGGVQSGVSRR